MQALAPLILVLAAAGGTVEVPLEARLVVTHRRVVPAPPPRLAARYAPGWIIVASDVLNSASARRGGPTWKADVQLVAVPDEPGLAIEVAITYLADVRVEREALEVRLPADTVRAVWRDGRLREAPPLLRIDRWSPRVAVVRSRGATLLLDGAGVEGMEVRRERGQVTVRLELDEAASHPFTVERGCRAHWRGARGGAAESGRLRLAGEKVVHRARLHVGETPLLVQRLGQGRRAAVVFSDHADQSSAATLRALLYGESDERGTSGGGFLGHALPMTKALFWRNAPGPAQLESPEVRQLAATLRRAGGEIALHSPTPDVDPRARVEEALRDLRDLEVRTWIDHQPATNCEAFANRGWRPDRDQGIADLLAATGVRYVWAAGPEKSDDLNLLRPREPATRTPSLYPWAAPTREARAAGLYLFRSVWAYLERDRFFKLLSPARLDRLTEERGVAILHTYLEAIRREPRLRPRNLLRRDSRTGRVALDPRLETLLADLSRRQQGGVLWVTTVRNLGDHLRSLEGLVLEYDRDGSARLRNRGPEMVRAVTLHLPVPGARLQVSDALGTRADADGPALWLDLAPGATARVTALDAAGSPLPFVRPAAVRFREGARGAAPR